MPFTTFNCSSVNSTERAGFSASRASLSEQEFHIQPWHLYLFVSPFFLHGQFVYQRTPRSARINSKLITSISSIGSTFPETWVILSSAKQRTT